MHFLLKQKSVFIYHQQNIEHIFGKKHINNSYYN